MSNRILIVDDDPSVVKALQRSLRAHFGQSLITDGEADPLLALAHARVQAYDVVLSDLRTAETDGIGLLGLMAALQPACVRILLAGTADFGTAQRAIAEAGVFRAFCQPWDEHELCTSVESAIVQSVLLKGGRIAPASRPEFVRTPSC